MSGSILTLDGIAPAVDPTAWVAQTATLVGKVEVGAGSSVWYGCVLRGDGDWIRVGQRTNIQDGTVIHINRAMPCTIGSDVTVGHMCLIHACTLDDGSFVGMTATVMDEAVVESGAMVAAGALVTPGKRVKAGEIWAGSPARFWRRITPEDAVEFAGTAKNYAERAQTYLAHFGRKD